MTKASVTLRQTALFDRKYSWLGGIAEQVAALEEENARLRAELDAKGGWEGEADSEISGRKVADCRLDR